MSRARRQSARDRTLCETLHVTGCWPSEILESTPAQMNLTGETIVIRNLTKRMTRRGAVPL